MWCREGVPLDAPARGRWSEANRSPSVKDGVIHSYEKDEHHHREARQFAFVKGNRAINAKTVKAKENSIKEYGQLSPIIVVKGEDVYLMDGHLVDLDGNDIPDDQTENYYAVLDGQHRLVAYLNLKLNLDDFVICEPLNVEMSIAALIAEMNICTKTWTGTDYMAAPAMMLGVENKVFAWMASLIYSNIACAKAIPS